MQSLTPDLGVVTMVARIASKAMPAVGGGCSGEHIDYQGMVASYGQDGIVASRG